MQTPRTPTHRSAARLLNVEQAAAYLNVTDACIRTLITEHRIAHYRLGRAIRMDARDVDSVLSGIRLEPGVGGAGDGIARTARLGVGGRRAAER